MNTLYCKEIHFYYRNEKYILKYFGVTNNFTFRKYLYSINDKNKTTFIQCCIKDIFLKNSIPFEEFPIKMIKNNISSEDISHFEELKIVLHERMKKHPNYIVFGSFFTFPLWKIRNQRNPVHFLIDFGNTISEKLGILSEENLKIFHSISKNGTKEEIINFLEKNKFEDKKEMEDIYLGYGGFCYRCKEDRHIQRLCQK